MHEDAARHLVVTPWSKEAIAVNHAHQMLAEARGDKDLARIAPSSTASSSRKEDS
jgi:hypothetical protein